MFPKNCKWNLTPEPLPQSALEQAVIANLHQQQQQKKKKNLLDFM